MEGTNRRKKRINRKKIKRLLMIIACCYAVVTMARIVIGQEQGLARQRAQASELALQIQQVQYENEQLVRKIAFAETDSYIERIARDQLGYVKENEIRFVEGE